MKKVILILVAFLFTSIALSQETAKVFVKNNYFYVDLSTDLVEYKAHAKEVFVRRVDETSTEFYFDNLDKWNRAERLDISQLQKEDGSPYTLVEFIAFYEEFTGFSSASGGSDAVISVNGMTGAVVIPDEVVSPNAENRLTEDVNGLAYLSPECEDLTEQFVTGATNNGGTGSGLTGLAVTEITVNKSQDITVVHTGTGFTGAAGSGFGVSSVPLGDNSADVNGSDIFTSGGDRIFDATPSKTYTVSLPNAGTYYIGVFSGGLSSVTSHTLDVSYCKPAFDVDLHFVETRCYEDLVAALPVLDNDGFVDEINATQLATLPAGAHMRWTSPSAATLDTLELNGFNGTVAISWSASTGDTGSQSVTFSGGVNPELINLGGIALGAGDTIDFTLESISAGQMQLTTPTTSIANGWTALQDYSAFATTSHWATRLLTSAATIEHKVNVYEDSNGDTSYREVIGENLTPINQGTIDTYTLCPEEDPNQQTTEETLIFRHHIGNAGVFTTLTETETVNANSTDPANEDKFSLLSDLESYRSSDGLFRFRLRYVELNKEIEWTQSNNPVADKANSQNADIAQNVTIISSTDAAVLGTAVSAFGGFNNNTISPNTFYDLNPGASWWYPIGQRVLFNGGMPAYNAGTSIVTNGAMEIYVTKVTGGDIVQIVDTSEPQNLIREGVNGTALLTEDDLPISSSVSNYSKKEIWLKIGQSNSVGTDGSGPIDHNGLDAVHPKVFEYSRGINKAEYRAAPVGDLMAYRNPAQDDGSGIGFGQLFGKTRVELNPEIEQLIIINRGVGGTGFAGNRWNVGDDLYTLAVNDLKQALTDYPDAVFKGIIWHQGESDAGQGQAFYEAALAAMVEGIRTEARNVAVGRAEGVFICGTMVESWIAANETARRPIDLAHRNVSNYITGSTFADFSDLVENQDAIHFGTNDLREMGKRYAKGIQDVFASILPSYRIKVQNGEVVDLFNGGGKVFDIITVTDSERGEVLDTDSRGFQTSMVLNNEQYTKSGWLNLQTVPTTFGNFISGLINGGTLADGHYWGWVGSGQGGSSTGANSTGLSGNATLNNWVHATLTSNGTNHELFINGVSVGTEAIGNVLSPPQLVELGTIGGNVLNTLDALLDDIVILPYALNADGAQKLYELVQQPIINVNNTSNTAETEYNIEGSWLGNQRYTQTVFWTGAPASPLLLSTTIDPTKVIKIEGIGIAGGGSAWSINTSSNGTAGNATRVNSAGTGIDVTEYGGFSSSGGGHVTVHYYK